MFKLIEKLRQKPERTKKQIAFATAFLLVSLIFVVWLSVIYPDFRRGQQKEDVVSKLEPSPLGTLGETFKEGLSAVGEQFTELKESVLSIYNNSQEYHVATTSDSSKPTVWAVSNTVSTTTLEQ